MLEEISEEDIAAVSDKLEIIDFVSSMIGTTQASSNPVLYKSSPECHCCDS